MEHYNLVKNLLAGSGFILEEDKIGLLSRYAKMIFDENLKFNLTGFKTMEDLAGGLIAGSLLPFKSADVPRGTIYCDLGTGSGVPGIPLGIVFNSAQGVLVDSNIKKNNFMNQVFAELEIKNISAACSRTEDFGQIAGNREKFSLVVSRAFAPEYIVIEMAAPLLSKGGELYIYSNKKISDLPLAVVSHAGKLGLEPGNVLNIDVSSGGIAFVKTGKTAGSYPRRYPLIKRDSEKAVNE